MRRAEARDRLRELIDGGDPGEVLPSERDLSLRLGVSRPTLRAAFDDLIRDGLVVRRHGRGTFISQPMNSPTLQPADGDWASVVLEFGVAAADAVIAQRLRLTPGEQVVRALRRRDVDGQPMAIEEIRLPASLVPGIRAADFGSGSLYARLRDTYRVRPADATQTTGATVTDAAQSRLLDVPLYSPALQFERVSRDDRGRTFELTRSVYRGDRYRLTHQLSLG